jgi:hypothetical protein
MKLQKLQSALTQYCKTGAWDEALGPIPSRLPIYREMVEHNFNAALSKAYPIARKSIGEALWATLLADFLVAYREAEAHYLELPKALIEFELTGEWGTKQGLPWLAELLEFEWTQVMLFNKADSEAAASRPFSTDLNSPIYFSPDWELLELGYPFYRKDWQQAPGQYFLLLYRDKNSLEVENLELNHFLAAFWLALAESPGVAVIDVLTQLLQQYQIDLNEGVLVACQGFLGDMGGRLG